MLQKAEKKKTVCRYRYRFRCAAGSYVCWTDLRRFNEPGTFSCPCMCIGLFKAVWIYVVAPVAGAAIAISIRKKLNE